MKNDCSAEIVTLNLNTMIEVAAIAFARSKDAVEDRKHRLDNLISEGWNEKDKQKRYHLLCSAHCEQAYFLDAAKDYAAAADQLFYLIQARDREEIVISRE